MPAHARAAARSRLPCVAATREQAELPPCIPYSNRLCWRCLRAELAELCVTTLLKLLDGTQGPAFPKTSTDQAGAASAGAPAAAPLAPEPAKLSAPSEAAVQLGSTAVPAGQDQAARHASTSPAASPQDAAPAAGLPTQGCSPQQVLQQQDAAAIRCLLDTLAA